MDEKTTTFISELDEGIAWHYRKYHQLMTLQWTVMIFVALAGVFTTAAGWPTSEDPAGLPTSEGKWIAEPYLLVICGAVVAVGAVVNQLGNPTKRAEHQLKIKLVYKAIKGAIRYRGLSLDTAQKAKSMAWTNPDGAVEMVNQWNPENAT